ncbi:MAG: 6-phosphogluconolactonase [Neptuniibacter sp.]
MSKIDFDLPPQVEIRCFDSADDACTALSEKIESIITDAVKEQKEASIALSGGSTPVPMLQALSKKKLPWDKLTVALVDDRWVPPSHKDSNEALVTKYLLDNNAKKAEFIGFWKEGTDAFSAETECNAKLTTRLPDMLDCVVLGMGNDGHTASLFPEAPQLSHALNTKAACCLTTPMTAPHDRMTMSATRLLSSKHRFLHLKGEDKLETLKSAISDTDITSMPIRLFLNHPLTIFWSP